MSRTRSLPDAWNCYGLPAPEIVSALEGVAPYEMIIIKEAVPWNISGLLPASLAHTVRCASVGQ